MRIRYLAPTGARPQTHRDSISMSRQRVRRSFTVEVKSSTRQGASITIPSRAQAASRAEPATPRSSPWDIFAPPPAAAPAAAEPPRILQNLLIAEAPEPEDDPVPQAVAEPALPRVRRIKRVAKPVATVAAARAVAAPEPLPEPEPTPRVQAMAAIVTEPGRAPKRRLAGAVEASTLRRGERWKRRLPRSCW